MLTWTELMLIINLFLDMLASSTSLTGQEVCKSRDHLDCFECDSDLLPQCIDPFNATDIITNHQVPVRSCAKGCCIKMTERANKTSPVSRVVRTCSTRDDFRIDTQLLSHVCITHWQGKGELCFCESDRCNSANINANKLLNPTILASTVIFIIVVELRFCRLGF